MSPLNFTTAVDGPAHRNRSRFGVALRDRSRFGVALRDRSRVSSALRDRSRVSSALRDRSRSRRGVAMIVAVVVIFLASVTATIVAQAALAQRQVSRANELSAQAEELVRAGIALARVRLAGDAAYGGESWQVALDNVFPNYTATVEITRLAASDDRAAAIRVEALISRGEHQGVRRAVELPLSSPFVEIAP